MTNYRIVPATTLTINDFAISNDVITKKETIIKRTHEERKLSEKQRQVVVADNISSSFSSTLSPSTCQVSRMSSGNWRKTSSEEWKKLGVLKLRLWTILKM